jgi:hypothetical protein
MPASALAVPQLWADKTRTTLLRDVNTTPAHQPDALELANNGNVELKTTPGTITCGEVELGSTVVSNTAALAKLALPFGVAEGDNCNVSGLNVPTYFDTLAAGPVGNAANGNVASITFTEPKAGEVTATLTDLKLSHNIPGIGFCTSNLSGIKAPVTNVMAGFVEENPPNLNVQFTKVKVPITGVTGCPAEGEFTGNFFLETPSTTSDTGFVEPPPVITAKPKSWNAGKFKVGGANPPTIVITYKNEGPGEWFPTNKYNLTIVEGAPADKPFSAKNGLTPCNKAVPVGKTCEVVMEFNPPKLEKYKDDMEAEPRAEDVTLEGEGE